MPEVVVALSVPHTIAGAQVFPCWDWVPDAVAGHDIGPLTLSRGQNFPQEHLLVNALAWIMAVGVASYSAWSRLRSPAGM